MTDTSETPVLVHTSTDDAGHHVESQEATVPEKVSPEEDMVKKKRIKRAEPSSPPTREPGKSLLPFSRVQKIIKADKEIPIIAKDATFLISLATEEFIQRLCEAAQRMANRERRATVQYKDIATVVRKVDEFLFLEEIIPWTTSDPPRRPKPGKGTTNPKSAPTALDQFIGVKGREETTGTDDVIMNEDGTMVAAGFNALDHEPE